MYIFSSMFVIPVWEILELPSASQSFVLLRALKNTAQVHSKSLWGHLDAQKHGAGPLKATSASLKSHTCALDNTFEKTLQESCLGFKVTLHHSTVFRFTPRMDILGFTLVYIYICIYIYIYILVDPLPGVETNSYLVNWLTGLLVNWLSGLLVDSLTA